MRKFRSFAFYWLPVLALMSLIFCASGDAGSSKQTSRFLGPLLHRLLPGLSDATDDRIIYGIRKCAHLSEYALLALLCWRARRHPAWPDPRPWSWPTAAEALWLAVLYSATDEFHQTFIPSREGCLRDVCIDSTGAAAGLLLLWLVGRRWRLWPPAPPLSAADPILN